MEKLDIVNKWVDEINTHIIEEMSIDNKMLMVKAYIYDKLYYGYINKISVVKYEENDNDFIRFKLYEDRNRGYFDILYIDIQNDIKHLLADKENCIWTINKGNEHFNSIMIIDPDRFFTKYQWMMDDKLNLVLVARLDEEEGVD